tara:strand:- start:58 stop:258 length:201 start_codon:yes stop_codon:yes gene_type:complete
MDTGFTPEQMEQIKILLMVVLAIPGFFLLRFIAFMILPRSILRLISKKYKIKNEHLNKREKKFYED